MFDLQLHPPRTLVMGIVNVTADSFSDGGKYLAIDAAVAHAHQLMDQGADLIDVGAESTRPGATRVDAQLEAQRVSTVIRELAAAGIATSVDTMRADTAEAALLAGVNMINDVSGGLADPRMFAVMAASGVPVCLMHWNTTQFGNAAGHHGHPGGVVAHVRTTLRDLTERAVAAGVEPGQVIWDPGLGFAKTAAENWELLGALDELHEEGYPLLVGASRKRFLTALRTQRGMQATPVDADAATCAVTTLAAQAGVWAVRVHDAAGSRDAAEAVTALRAHADGGER